MYLELWEWGLYLFLSFIVYDAFKPITRAAIRAIGPKPPTREQVLKKFHEEYQRGRREYEAKRKESANG